MCELHSSECKREEEGKGIGLAGGLVPVADIHQHSLLKCMEWSVGGWHLEKQLGDAGYPNSTCFSVSPVLNLLILQVRR